MKKTEDNTRNKRSMSLITNAVVRLPLSYKRKLEAQSENLQKINEVARIATARSDEYDMLMLDATAVCDLMYTSAQHMVERHSIDVTLPTRPATRVTFMDKQQDLRACSYALLAVTHLLSASVDQYTAAAADAVQNASALHYDRADPGSVHISAYDIVGHTSAIKQLFGDDEDKDEEEVDFRQNSVPSFQREVALVTSSPNQTIRSQYTIM